MNVAFISVPLICPFVMIQKVAFCEIVCLVYTVYVVGVHNVNLSSVLLIKYRTLASVYIYLTLCTLIYVCHYLCLTVHKCDCTLQLSLQYIKVL